MAAAMAVCGRQDGSGDDVWQSCEETGKIRFILW
jgi:hypothetical protein